MLNIFDLYMMMNITNIDNIYIYSLKTNFIILPFSLSNKIFILENKTKIEQCGSV